MMGVNINYLLITIVTILGGLYFMKQFRIIENLTASLDIQESKESQDMPLNNKKVSKDTALPSLNTKDNPLFQELQSTKEFETGTIFNLENATITINENSVTKKPPKSMSSMTCNCWPVYSSKNKNNPNSRTNTNKSNNSGNMNQHQPGGSGHRPDYYSSRHGKKCNKKKKQSNQETNQSNKQTNQSNQQTNQSNQPSKKQNYDFTQDFPTRQSVTGYFTERGIPGAPGYALISPYR